MKVSSGRQLSARCAGLNGWGHGELGDGGEGGAEKGGDERGDGCVIEG